MKAVYPSYTKGLVNVYSALERFFGFETKYSSLRKVEQLLKEEEYKNIIVLVYKGLSSSLLESCLDNDGILFKNKFFDVTSTIDNVELNYEKDFLYKSQNFSKRIVERINSDTDYKAYGVFSHGDLESLSDVENYQKIMNLSSINDRKVIYGYFDELSKLICNNGTNSDIVRNKLSSIDENIKMLAEGVENTLILVTGDVGYIDNNYIDLVNYKEVGSLIKDIKYKGLRSCFVTIKSGYLEEFKLLMRQEFGKNFVLLDKNQAIDKNLLEDESEFLGDYLILASGNYSFIYGDLEQKMSSYGGISEEEMVVPIIAIKKKPYRELVRKVKENDFQIIYDTMKDIQLYRVGQRRDIFLKTEGISKSEFLGLCSRSSTDIGFVYEINEEIVGFVIVRLKSSFGDRIYLNHDYLNIQYIYVFEEYRRRGIATKLYQEVLNYAKRLRFRRVEFSLWYFDSDIDKFIASLKPKLLHKIYEFYL